MTREESWNIEDSTTLAILRHVSSLGFVVSVNRIPSSLLGQPGHVEMTALDLSAEPPARHTAKIVDTESGDLLYRCACLLAESVGIDFE